MTNIVRRINSLGHCSECKIFDNVVFVFAFCLFGFGSVREFMKVQFENSVFFCWLNKKVLQSHMLDDMDNLDGWKSYIVGVDAIVDVRVVSKLVDMANVATISISM